MPATRVSIRRASAVGLAALLVLPSIAEGNATLGAFSYFLPRALAAAPLVLLLETLLARRILQVGWRRAFGIALVASLAATLASALAVVVLPALTVGWVVSAESTPARGLEAAIVWVSIIALLPCFGPNWSLLAVSGLAIIPLVLLSVAVEARVVTAYLGADTRARARRFAWSAAAMGGGAVAAGIVASFLLAELIVLWGY